MGIHAQRDFVSASYLSLTQAAQTYLPVSGSVSWLNLTNKPNETGSGSLVYSNSPSLIRPILTSPEEAVTISSVAVTGSVNFDILSQSVLYYTSSAIGNWVINVRGNSTTSLSSVLNVGESMTITFFATQGASAYYHTGLQIDGQTASVRWQNGYTPTEGYANGVDIYSFSIIRTSSATSGYSVFGSQVGYQ